jgi:hypothetical protein
VNDSPHEYIERLKLENKTLRRALVESAAQLERTRLDLARAVSAYLMLQNDHAGEPI